LVAISHRREPGDVPSISPRHFYSSGRYSYPCRMNLVLMGYTDGCQSGQLNKADAPVKAINPYIAFPKHFKEGRVDMLTTWKGQLGFLIGFVLGLIGCISLTPFVECSSRQTPIIPTEREKI
jgi:hypothetical protein